MEGILDLAGVLSFSMCDGFQNTKPGAFIGDLEHSHLTGLRAEFKMGRGLVEKE